MSFVIRTYVSSDNPQLARLLVLSVRELGRRYYSEEQIAAWLAQLPDEADLAGRCERADSVFVALGREKKLLGMILLEGDGHIDLFYCLPEASGQGVGTALLSHSERCLCNIAGARLFVEASEGARPVFIRHGFVDLGRRDFEISGVKIHNYAMEKMLVTNS